MNVAQGKQTADKHASTLLAVINASARRDIQLTMTEPVQVIRYPSLIILENLLGSGFIIIIIGLITIIIIIIFAPVCTQSRFTSSLN